MQNSATVKSQTFEMKIGKTTFIVTEELSPEARETVNEKLHRIMSRNVNNYNEGSIQNG
jgi:hypothetical protein